MPSGARPIAVARVRDTCHTSKRPMPPACGSRFSAATDEALAPAVLRVIIAPRTWRLGHSAPVSDVMSAGDRDYDVMARDRPRACCHARSWMARRPVSGCYRSTNGDHCLPTRSALRCSFAHPQGHPCSAHDRPESLIERRRGVRACGNQEQGMLKPRQPPAECSFLGRKA